MGDKVTVIYYSANTEAPEFEQSIMDRIMALKGDLQLVSVTQIPVDFGHNICVGRRKNCYTSEYMQVRLALEAVETEWVLTTEADFIHPPEYFRYVPEGDSNVYRYNNVWIAHEKFYFKGMSDGCQIVRTKAWLDRLNQVLPDKDNWEQEMQFHPQFSSRDAEMWGGGAAVSFKSTFGVSRKTRLKKEVPSRQSLEGWGDIDELKAKMKFKEV